MHEERVIERASLADVLRPPTVLYSDAHPLGRSSQTRDGGILALALDFPRRGEVWLANLATGARQEVASMQDVILANPVVSPDGARVVFTSDPRGASQGGSSLASGAAGAAGKRRGYVVDSAGGVPRLICEDCEVWGFLADSRRVLLTDRANTANGGANGWVLDVTTAARQDVLKVADAAQGLVRLHASPDDRWLAFRRIQAQGGKTFVASLRPGVPPGREAWQEVQEPTTTGRPCGWSLDSQVLYLLLDTDGFRCLWGQRIDPSSGRLIGAPFVVRHFHSRRSDFSTSFGNAIGPDGFLFEGIARSANLFRVALPPR
jgi:hypothetical protein